MDPAELLDCIMTNRSRRQEGGSHSQGVTCVSQETRYFFRCVFVFAFMTDPRKSSQVAAEGKTHLRHRRIYGRQAAMANIRLSKHDQPTPSFMAYHSIPL